MSHKKQKFAAELFDSKMFRATLPDPTSTIELKEAGADVIEAHTIHISENNIYISDEFAHRVLCFGRDGILKWQTGNQQPEDFKFSYPRGLLLLEEELWICDSLNNRVLVAESDTGKIITEIKDSDNFHEPVDLLLRANGAVLVIDRRHQNLVQISRSKKEIERWSSLKKYEGNSLHEYLRIFAATSNKLKRQLQFDYPNQIASQQNTFWLADNKSITSYNKSMSIIATRNIEPLFCLRGLTAMNDSAVFLDEFSKHLMHIDLCGEISELGYKQIVFAGCGSDNEGGFVALADNVLHFWSQEQILSAVKQSNPEHRKEVAGESEIAVKNENRSDEEIALELIRSSALDQIDEKQISSALEISKQRISEAALSVRTNYFRLRELPLSVLPELAEIVPHDEHVPGVASLVNTMFRQKETSQHVETFYAALRQLYLWLNVATSRDKSLTAGNSLPDSRQQADILNLLKQDLLATAEQAAKDKSSSLGKIIGKMDKIGPDQLSGYFHQLSGQRAHFTIAHQALAASAGILEQLLRTADPDYLDKEEHWDIILETWRDEKKDIATIIQYANSKVPERWVGDAKGLSSKQLHQVELFANSVVDLVNAREEYLGTAPATVRNHFVYLKHSWHHLQAIQTLALKQGLTFTPLWDKSIKQGGQYLKYLGFEEKAEKLKDDSNGREAAVAGKPTAKANTAELFRIFYDKDLSTELLTSKIITYCKKNTAAIFDTFVHLWRLMKPEDFLELASELKAFTHGDEKTKTQIVNTYCLLAAIAFRRDEMGIFNMCKAEINSLAPDPTTFSSEVGKKLARLKHYQASVKFLEEAFHQRESPVSVVALNESLVNAGEVERANSLRQEYLYSANIDWREKASLRSMHCWQEMRNALPEMVRHVNTNRYIGNSGLNSSLQQMVNYGYLHEVAEYIARQIDRNPENQSLFIMLARCQLLTRQTAELQTTMKQFRKENLPLLQIEKKLFEFTGAFDKAIEVSNTLHQLGLSGDKELVYQASLAMFQSKYQQAQELLDSIEDNSDAVRDRDLGRATLLMWSFSYGKALSQLDAIDEKYGYFWNTDFLRIRVLTSLGRYDEATRVIEQMMLLGSTIPQLTAMLANILIRKGGYEQGRKLAQSSLWRSQWGPYGLQIAYQYGKSFEQQPATSEDEEFIEAFEKHCHNMTTAMILKAMLESSKNNHHALENLRTPKLITSEEDAYLALVAAGIHIKAKQFHQATSVLEPYSGKFALEDILLIQAEAALAAGKQEEARQIVHPLGELKDKNSHLQKLLLDIG